MKGMKGMTPYTDIEQRVKRLSLRKITSGEKCEECERLVYHADTCQRIDDGASCVPKSARKPSLEELDRL